MYSEIFPYKKKLIKVFWGYFDLICLELLNTEL